MLDNKLCLTSVVEFLRRGRVDRGTGEGKIVVVVDSSKRQIAFHVFWVVVNLRPVVVIVGIKFKTHFAKILHNN